MFTAPHTTQIPPLTPADICRFTLWNESTHQRCLGGHIMRTLPTEYTNPRFWFTYESCPLRQAVLQECRSRNLPFRPEYYDNTGGAMLSAYNDDYRNSTEVLADVFNTAARALGLLNE